MNKRILCAALALPAFASLASAQLNTTTSSTLSAAMDSQQKVLCLTSTTGVVVPTLQQPNFIFFATHEAMRLNSQLGSSNCYLVSRGQDGTAASAHASGETVYLGPSSTPTGQLGPFVAVDPTVTAFAGPCVRGNQSYLPMIDEITGNVWDCPASGPRAALWTRTVEPNPYSFTDGVFFFDWGDCQSSVSGNGTGTNGYTTAGTSGTPVVQAQTSATGTNTHTYVCIIRPPGRLNGGKGIAISDVTFFYGVQTAALGTQANVLASGTFNGSTVFGQITFPGAGASETASTVAPARVDSGTLAITPAVGSFNTATTTAGAFYSVKFTPASPIAMATDLQSIVLTVTFQCSATTATITNSPGGIVHYINVPI